MLDFNKKIKYSFVLCLALLFSFSFAGSITVNGNYFDCPNISSDYTVSFPDCNIYTLTYEDNYFYGSTQYTLTFYDENNLNNMSVLGSEYYDFNAGVYQFTNLAETNNGLYGATVPYAVRYCFSTNGVVSKYYINGYEGVYSTDIYPSTSDFGNNVVASYNTVFYQPIDILTSSFDVYEYDPVSYTLGNLIYSKDGSSDDGYFFSQYMTPDEINDTVVSLLNSSGIVDNVPSNYSNFFVISDSEDESLFHAFFFPDVPGSNYPYGLIYTDNDPLGYKIHFDYGLVNTPPGSYNYVWIMFNGSDSWTFGTYQMKLFNDNLLNYFDFNSQPVIYCNFPFDFYTVTDGVVSSDIEFTLSYYDVTDENDNVITSSGALSQNKNDNSIWSMLWNIFNPSSNSSSEMSNIENAHQQIIDYSDTTSFWEIFSSNNGLLDFTSISWLLVANNLLFSHFAGFLALCCFFITVSRLMR